MAERAKKFAGPKLPATLGNVALSVSEYTSKDGVTSVKGTQLQNGEELTVQLMSPARAANMMKGRNDVDDRERVRLWEDRFANRRELCLPFHSPFFLSMASEPRIYRVLLACTAMQAIF